MAKYILIDGNPLHPRSDDLIAALELHNITDPIPNGWNLLCGANDTFIGRIDYRHKIGLDLIDPDNHQWKG